MAAPSPTVTAVTRPRSGETRPSTTCQSLTVWGGPVAHRWGNRSRHERGYGAAWDKLRLVTLRRDSYLCQPCVRRGRVAAANSVDHILAKHRGGTDDPSNLESTCRPCHDVKSAQEAAEAQGRTYRPKVRIGKDGWPVED